MQEWFDEFICSLLSQPLLPHAMLKQCPFIIGKKHSPSLARDWVTFPWVLRTQVLESMADFLQGDLLIFSKHQYHGYEVQNEELRRRRTHTGEDSRQSWHLPGSKKSNMCKRLEETGEIWNAAAYEMILRKYQSSQLLFLIFILLFESHKEDISIHCWMVVPSGSQKRETQSRVPGFMGARDTTAWAITCYLPGYLSSRNVYQARSWGSNPSILIWDARISAGVDHSAKGTLQGWQL